MMPRSLLFLALLLPLQDALRDRVSGLVDRLGKGEAADRDKAEKALIDLGARALPLLPEPGKGMADDQKARLGRVREALAESQDALKVEASKVTIRGKGIRLTEAIKALQAQTGNRVVDQRELNGDEATNPALDLDLADRPFFEALDIIAKQARLTPTFYTLDTSVGLLGGGSGKPDMITAKGGDRSWISYAGPFRVRLKRVSLDSDLEANNSAGRLQCEIAWEPRLRPMLLALKADGVLIVDDRGEVVPPDVADESGTVVLRPENPAAELNIGMDVPDRQAGAKALKSVKVRGEVSIPAGLRQFRFPKLDAANAEQKQGPIGVKLESTVIDEGVWKVRIWLEMPGEGPAFESYRQGLFNNRVWLQKADGERIELNGGFSSLSSGGGRLGFEYNFVDVPGKPANYSLVYETPSRVVAVPFEFEFRDVPLP